MNIPRFSVKNPFFVNMIAILIYVVGFISLLSIQREMFPPTTLDYVTIQTIYPGATAESVERLVTGPLEDALPGIKGIKEITSTSISGFSSIVVELREGVQTPKEAADDIQSAIDKIYDLPEEAEDPEVNEVDLEIPVLQISIAGEATEQKLRDHMELLEDQIKKLKGVSSVSRSGYRKHEIWVEVDPDKMFRYNIALSQVISSIQSKNINMPAGRVTEGSREFMIKTTGEIRRTEEVSRVVLRANDDGNTVRVSDVAKVSMTYEEAEQINRTMGERDISLTVMKDDTADAIRVADSVKKILKKTDDPEGIQTRIVNDTTYYIKRRLRTLTGNSLIGFVLVFLVLLLFLNKRIAVITALGIPFSIFATFIIMNLFGLSINMLSMFGLILVLGMLVDDAIVISENSYRYMEMGYSPPEAAEKGAKEVMMPVMASVLTTVAAFFPLLFIPGIMGKFIKNIPLAVIIALLASLIEAFLILPSHIGDFVKPLKHKKKEVRGKTAEPQKKQHIGHRIMHAHKRLLSSDRKGSDAKWYIKLVVVYKRILNFTLKKRYLFMGLASLVFVLSVLFAVKVMKFELMSGASFNEFSIHVTAKDDASLEFTEKQVLKIEDLLSTLPEYEMDSYTSIIGAENSMGSSFPDKDSNLATIQVYLTDEKDRERNAFVIIKELKERCAKMDLPAEIRFETRRAGPPVGKPVEFELRGDDFIILMEAAAEVRKEMETTDGLKDIVLDFKEGKQEIEIRLDEKRAAMAGVPIAQAASIIHTAFQGMKATSVRIANESVDIIVKFDEEHSKSYRNLQNIYIPNMRGQLIPLSEIASFEFKKTVKRINRTDGKRTITLSAEINPQKVNSRDVNKTLRPKVEELMKAYPELSLRSRGEEESSRESIAGLLRAFLIAFLLIYFILVTMFKSVIQPLIIMVTIPFGFIGVVIALFMHGLPMGFLPMMAIVALSGVVVNNSIVLIDFVNQSKKTEKKTLHDLVLQAGEVRFRPVLLTTITTIAGLFSMAYGLAGGDPMLKPLAIAFMWGLFFATILTLILVPTLYMIFDDIGNVLKKTFSRKSKDSDIA